MFSIYAIFLFRKHKIVSLGETQKMQGWEAYHSAQSLQAVVIETHSR